ncbi:hypothetical protein [Candidatus Protochlamydia sp. W-9]|uniref:hypothetical protein n=1 Tax=Candidatus Protochlamydia sp. W-9 TaxID=1785087 RepID=UPI00096A5DDC|nr:hypothetical protein [Candidatus Protochlamydia sp. W-9]
MRSGSKKIGAMLQVIDNKILLNRFLPSPLNQLKTEDLPRQAIILFFCCKMRGNNAFSAFL